MIDYQDIEHTPLMRNQRGIVVRFAKKKQKDSIICASQTRYKSVKFFFTRNEVNHLVLLRRRSPETKTSAKRTQGVWRLALKRKWALLREKQNYCLLEELVWSRFWLVVLSQYKLYFCRMDVNLDRSYREEFKLQQGHYNSLKDLYVQNPSGNDKEEEFADLIGFVAQMCTCYPEETKEFPMELEELLKSRHNELPALVKEKIVQSLIMLRNKKVVSPDYLVEVLFPILTTTESKGLRSQVYSALISLLKTENQGARNQKLNRKVQALLFTLLANTPEKGLWATKITRELWRRGIWDDPRTVEIMATSAVSNQGKVVVSAVRFFLGGDKEREEAQNESDGEDEFDVSAVKHQASINKKSSKREKKVEAAMRAAKKKREAPHHSATYLNFSAIHLLKDPQTFAESLFSTHLVRDNGQNKDGEIKKAKLPLEQKIMILNLISRLVGTHKLTLLKLYSYIATDLKPKTRDVTQLLAAAAQASHDLVPPEYIEPVVKKIAMEFVSDGVAAEVASAGLNSIREIVSRAPLAMNKELLSDLIEYKGSKSKAVTMAARSLITLFREVDPSMLPTKERGKAATMNMKEVGKENVGLRYGQDNSVHGIEGLGLLKQWKEDQGIEDNDEDGWEVESDDDDSDSDSEDGWIEVESDKEYEISDSDDEKDEEGNETKKTKTEGSIDDWYKYASENVITPADFAKLNELRAKAEVEKAMGKKKSKNEEEVDADSLIGPVKYKELREERIARAKEGKEGRDFKSKKGEKLAQKAHSTTNREKARKKNFMMMIHKKDVQGKAKRSLRDKQKVLRNHINKQKKKLK